MVETALYNRLEEYNQTIQNNYKSNWGSLLGDWLGEPVQASCLLCCEPVQMLIPSVVCCAPGSCVPTAARLTSAQLTAARPTVARSQMRNS